MPSIKRRSSSRLTEVHGPVTVCAWHAQWDEQPLDERAKIKSRQGVRYSPLSCFMAFGASLPLPQRLHAQ
ncbi:hypothetical protein FIV39_14750 [Pseudomonas grimontii]|uniref:Uncharacterized protein n=1 Tax=Pseudomonas grimontii TaxID=129847 RepID=A0A5C5PIA0_9PSED|nr:hypothetical protein FIV39_14750 [Pseudomonas grimontii]